MNIRTSIPRDVSSKLRELEIGSIGTCVTALLYCEACRHKKARKLSPSGIWVKLLGAYTVQGKKLVGDSGYFHPGGFDC